MMNNEDLERKMAFIVNQQAQFTVDIDKLREAQAKTEEMVIHLTAAQAKTEEVVIHLAAAQAKTEEVVTRLAYVTNEGFKEVNAKIDALVNSQIALQDSQKELQDSQKELQGSQKELQDSHKLTEESVRQLSMTVDRYFKNRRNGD